MEKQTRIVKIGRPRKYATEEEAKEANRERSRKASRERYHELMDLKKRIENLERRVLEQVKV